MAAMTGRELLEQLQEFSEEDLNKNVHFAYAYGDHWNTVVAAGVSYVAEGKVKQSTYHQKDTVVDEDSENFDPTDPKLRDVLIIWS